MYRLIIYKDLKELNLSAGDLQQSLIIKNCWLGQLPDFLNENVIIYL